MKLSEAIKQFSAPKPVLPPPAKPSEPERPASRIRPNKFCNKCVAFTGKLSTMNRSSAAKGVEKRGGFPTISVTTATDIIVYGQLRGVTSSKLTKARELRDKGQEILFVSEQEFIEMLNEAL